MNLYIWVCITPPSLYPFDLPSVDTQLLSMLMPHGNPGDGISSDPSLNQHPDGPIQNTNPIFRPQPPHQHQNNNHKPINNQYNQHDQSTQSNHYMGTAGEQNDNRRQQLIRAKFEEEKQEKIQRENEKQQQLKTLEAKILNDKTQMEVNRILRTKLNIQSYVNQNGRHHIPAEVVLDEELRVAIQQIVKEPMILDIVKSLQTIQEAKEEEQQKAKKALIDEQTEKRQHLQRLHKMRIEQATTQEKMDSTLRKCDIERNTLEIDFQEELVAFENNALKELEQQTTTQQTVLQQAGVPGIFVTVDVDDIAVHKCILEEIIRLVNT